MRHDGGTWARARLSRLVACLSADHLQMRYGAVASLARLLEEVDDPVARELFARLVETLRRHLTREEHVVFPLITMMENAALEKTDLPPRLERGLEPVIELLMEEHARIGALLAELRACPAVGEKIAGLESALDECMRLENTVLYPRALALEEELYTPVASRRTPVL